MSLQVGGFLTYMRDGRLGSVKVAMTWEALSLLRDEMKQSRRTQADELLIAAVLKHWGAEQLDTLLRTQEPLALAPLLLAFNGGPCSKKPRQLLIACGLLTPDVPLVRV